MSTPEERDASPEIRIGDRDREQAVAQLGQAFGEGRLEMAEYDERVASAYSAKTASDLLHLTADLPLATREHPVSAQHSGAPFRPDRGPRARRFTDEPSWLWRLWGTYASVVTLCVVIWLIVSLTGKGGMAYPWPLWVAGPWGGLLLFQTIGVLANRRGTGNNSDS